MVDYSRFNNIILSSDEEEENQRQNLQRQRQQPSPNFLNGAPINQQNQIVFADIEQVPEVTKAIEKLKSIISRINPEKVLKDITFGLLQDINNFSMLWEENTKNENILLLVNTEILEKYMEPNLKRAFFANLAISGGMVNKKNVLIIFSPFHDRWWYQGNVDTMDNNTMERWYQSWMSSSLACCICQETKQNMKLDQCGGCFSCVCKTCLEEHKEANNYPLLKCPICRRPFYQLMMIPTNETNNETSVPIIIEENGGIEN